jgi:hypothetical protein
LFVYFKEQGVQNHVTNHTIMYPLRLAGIAAQQPNGYTIGALHNTGAQALIQAQVPLPMIKLIGCWCSDEVFRYLTAWSEHLMHNPSSTPCSTMPTNSHHTHPGQNGQNGQFPGYSNPGLNLEEERLEAA